MKALLLHIVFIVNTLQAQSTITLKTVISDCEGATLLSNSGNYTIQFTGNSGDYNELKEHPELKEVKESNGVWFIFKAEKDGRFNLNGSVKQGALQLVVFSINKDNPCVSLQKGTSTLIRKVTSNKSNEISISLIAKENNAYPIDLKKNERILIFINSSEKKKQILSLNINFEEKEEKDQEANTVNTFKITDLRKDKNETSFKINIRDHETGKPIYAELSLYGMSEFEGKHTGSDFFFPINKSGKIEIKCDALGYFFNDREEYIERGTDHELIIYMLPIGHGKSFKIEEIEFISGTARLMPESGTKLMRLKDFLILNSGVKIEIQGHVNATGEENKRSAVKLSTKRAKSVYRYLVNSGIYKKRMTYKGYGGNVPIYIKPKYNYEHQANRRVEFKILE